VFGYVDVKHPGLGTGTFVMPRLHPLRTSADGEVAGGAGTGTFAAPCATAWAADTSRIGSANKIRTRRPRKLGPGASRSRMIIPVGVIEDRLSTFAAGIVDGRPV
jgi:hypothetical protein